MSQGFHPEGTPGLSVFSVLTVAAHVAVTVIHLCDPAPALHRPEGLGHLQKPTEAGEIPYLSAWAPPNSQAVTNKQKPLEWLINYISWCYL